MNRRVYKVVVNELNIAQYDEFNEEIRKMFNESHMEIGSKNVNKNYTLDPYFNGINRPTEQEFLRVFLEFDLNKIILHATQSGIYNMTTSDLRLSERILNSRLLTSNNRRTLQIKEKAIKRMYNKYKTVIKEEYIEKLKENIISKLKFIVRPKVSRSEFRKFKRHLAYFLLIEVEDITEGQIELNISLQPIFNFTNLRNRRVSVDVARRLNFENEEQTQRDLLNRRLNELRTVDPSLSNLDEDLGINMFQPDEEFRNLNPIEEILHTQEVTQNGPNLMDQQFMELEERLRRLEEDEPVQVTPEPEENIDDLLERFERLQGDQPVEQVNNEVERLIGPDLSELARNMDTDSDLRRELEELEREVNGGGNTQSKMTFFDDSDELPVLSDDAESDDIDSESDVVIQRRQPVNRTNYLYDLEVDEMTNLLNSIKINNGCDDIIKFCQVSKQVARDCRRIPEIRDNVYMPCIVESMIININNKYSSDTFYNYPDGTSINRKDFLEKEKQSNGTIEEYLYSNLECNDRLKKQLFIIINESLKQIPYFMNTILDIPISFLIFMITSVKEILNTESDNILDIYRKKVKEDTEPILEYQLVKFRELENMGISKYEINKCFIKYLELLLNYNINILM
tara:strand:+ start:3280 stop:5160 length:1881 start_codon:yes stop_codon:yes gene_type:complete